MLPVLLRLDIGERERRPFRLWLPVLIVWLLLAAVMLVCLPLVLLAALFAWPSGCGGPILAVYPLLISTLFNLSGLHIELGRAGERFLIDFQ